MLHKNGEVSVVSDVTRMLEYGPRVPTPSILSWTVVLNVSCNDESLISNKQFFKKNFLNSFIYLVCAESVAVCKLFSSCSEQGLLSNFHAPASHCCGFSCFGAQVLGPTGFRLQPLDSRAQAQQLFSSVQSLSCVRLFATPRTAAHQASLVHHQLPEFTQSHVH